MLPCLAAVDPELTIGLPAAITAATGADALTQLLEAFVSPKANPITDALCRHGLPLVARALPIIFSGNEEITARTDMALASLFSGLALSNAGLGAVHGIAGPLGGMLAAPHGALCGRLLPHLTAANVAALQRRDPNSPALGRYDEASRLLTGSSRATAQDGVAWLQEFIDSMAIPSLEAWGLNPDAIPDLLAGARQASSMQGNPITLSDAELIEAVFASLSG
jgi:alcohol dehydrogenase class IV